MRWAIYPRTTAPRNGKDAPRRELAYANEPPSTQPFHGGTAAHIGYNPITVIPNYALTFDDPNKAWRSQVMVAQIPALTPQAVASLEPGARTAWHSHPLGQTLIVTAGMGWVQQWGRQVEGIEQGDVLWIPPGQKHWHGAR
jgi:hypothetical protein